jgi:methionine-rich copper-binding protein CopC
MLQKILRNDFLLAMFLLLCCGIFSNSANAFYTGFSPANNAENVSVTTNLSVSFSRAWTWSGSGGYIRVRKLSDDSVFQSYYFDDMMWSYPGTITGEWTATMNISLNSGDLEAGETYYVTVDNWMIIDEWWMEYFNISNNTTWRFTTEGGDDEDPPEIVSLRPANDSTGAKPNTSLAITFDEPVFVKSGNITIKLASDNSNVEVLAVTSANVTGNGSSMITINLASSLAANTEYYVLIDDGALSDESDNDFGGVSSSATWSFTTGDAIGESWYNGDWNYRFWISIDSSKLSSDLTDFPVFVNLADLPEEFFNNVKSDGSDIRITKSDGITEVAREIVSIDNGDHTGEMHFLAEGTLSSSNDTDFFIYYGNPGATEPAESSDYGSEKVWVNDYVGVWHLNDSISSVSTTVRDSTSNKYHGTAYGSMSSSDVVSARLGLGFKFDGSNDYVSLPNMTTQFSSTATFSAWMKSVNSTPSVSTRTGFVQLSTAAYTSHYPWTDSILYINTFRNDRLTVGNNAGFNKANWHLLNISTSSGTNNYKIYQNKSNFYSTTGQSSVSIQTSSRLASSTDSFSNTFFYDGTMDEFRLSKTARSSVWIYAEYENQNSPEEFYYFGPQEEGDSEPNPPVIASLSPADDSVNVAIDTNLVITFNEIVNVNTGNLTILLSSNDSVFETISVGSGQVTGNGTTTITINPNADLSYDTEYYVLIDNGAFQNADEINFAGISNKTTWNFTTEEELKVMWAFDEWESRIKLTVNAAQVSSNLTNFPVYVNMSHFPAGFFSAVKPDGADIRISTVDGTPCATEIVSIDTANGTGEMHFKAPLLSSSSDTVFWVYYDNPNARMLNGAHEYGSQNVWSNGYVAVYHMQQDPGEAGALIKDSTRYHNHGSPQGGMTVGDSVAGKLGNGNALDFDGSNDYINLGDTDVVDFGTGDFEFSAWAKTNNTATQQMLFGKDTIGARQFEFRTSGTGGVRFSYWTSGSMVYRDQASILQDTSWHHVVALKRGTSFEIYQDGSLAGSGTTGGSHGSVDATSASLRIGSREYSGFQSYFDGQIDEARIANRANSAAWISAEYSNQNNPSGFYTIEGAAETHEDTDEPKLIRLVPDNASSHVPLARQLQMIFNRTISAGTGNIVITDTSDDSAHDTIACSGGQVSINGATVIISPDTNFTAGTTYYVTVPSTCFKDASENFYSGIESPFFWRFETQGSTGPHPLFFDGMF